MIPFFQHNKQTTYITVIPTNTESITIGNVIVLITVTGMERRVATKLDERIGWSQNDVAQTNLVGTDDGNPTTHDF